MAPFYRENDNGDLWYYSSHTQFNELMECLDSKEMEMALYRELCDNKEEIFRQMEITETLTNQFKGNKKSYLEVENGNFHSFHVKSRVKLKSLAQILGLGLFKQMELGQV